MASGISFAETYSIGPTDIEAEGAILINSETGQILFEKNSHKILNPASTTKVMTAILILEDCNLNDNVTIDAETPYTDGSRIYVEEGEVFTVEQLLHAMLITSANDAAVALAKHHSGTVEAFAEAMNKRAEELGALNTSFKNPNGLTEEGHLTTAYDLALIGKHATTMPKLIEIASTLKYTIPATPIKGEARYLHNKNRFLFGTGGGNRIDYKGQTIDIKYDVVTGLKTGFTNAAQQCFIVTAEKDGKSLVSVILKSKGDYLWIDSRTLIDFGFDNFNQITFLESGREYVHEYDDSKKTKIPMITETPISLMIQGEYDQSLTNEVMTLSDDLLLPVASGDILGEIEIFYNGESVGTTNLLSRDDISGKDMLDENTKSFEKPSSISSRTWQDYLVIALKILGALIIWRSIMTFIRIRNMKRKRT